MLKKHKEIELLQKGAFLPKTEIKKRLILLGTKFDPIDDNKTTYCNIYDSLLKDKASVDKLTRILANEKNLEPCAVGRKRRRSPSKKKTKRNQAINTSKKLNFPKNPVGRPPKIGRKTKHSKGQKSVSKSRPKQNKLRETSQKTTNQDLLKKPESKFQKLKTNETAGKPIPEKIVNLKFSKVEIDYKKYANIASLIDPEEEKKEQELSNKKYQNYVIWKNESGNKIPSPEKLVQSEKNQIDFIKNINRNLYNDALKNVPNQEERTFQEKSGSHEKNNNAKIPQNLFSQKSMKQTGSLDITNPNLIGKFYS